MDENKTLIADNSDIKKIYAKYNNSIGYYIEIEFSKKGAKKLESATEENLGKNLGIFVDGSPFAIAEVVAVIESGNLCLPPLNDEAQLLIAFATLT